MQHFRNLTDVQLDRPSMVTVGVFDGLHRGHQFLIQKLVKQAHASDRLAVVLTFFPHPDVVLRGLEGRYYLTSPDMRAHLLGELGVDVIVTHPFDDRVRQVRAKDFVDQLCNHLRLSSLWATADFALGYQREGNIDFLREQGHQKGFTVETIDLLTNDGQVIRSANIRSALREGDISLANHFLGRPYAVGGEVVHGEKRGRQIGFPTANLDSWPQLILPQNGVYACWAYLGDETFKAVTNIGHRPTFSGDGITVEAHLLDFDRDIYGQHLSLDFVERLRGEVKFSSIEALVAQIKQDVINGREILRAD